MGSISQPDGNIWVDVDELFVINLKTTSINCNRSIEKILLSVNEGRIKCNTKTSFTKEMTWHWISESPYLTPSH